MKPTVKNYFMLKSVVLSRAGSDEWLLECFYTASENVGCYLHQTVWESRLVVFTEVNIHSAGHPVLCSTPVGALWRFLIDT